MKKINVGIIGFGNVGSGVVKILQERNSLLSQKVGLGIQVKRISDIDLLSKRNVRIDKNILTKDALDIINDPQIDIVAELIGGIHPAKEYILGALKKGKNIVTANKALLALHGKELFASASDCGKNIYFEASVGAGIPIIKSLKEGLVANRFSNIYGIVNGTSNFILSQMSNNNCSFNEALKEAKAKGFAEKDPTLDIEGIDSAHKLVILTYLCFGKLISLDDVYIEGVSRISLADINYAKELNLCVKLLAIAKKDGDSLGARVHPTLIPNEHMLASVDEVNNAIYVSSDLAGNLLFYGPGAGQLSAASAVVSDIVDLTNDIKAGLFRSTLNIIPDKSIKRLSKIDEIQSRYYIRLMALDKPGVLAKISGILSKFGISIASVTQKERRKTQSVPIVMIIHEAKEKNLREALQIIDRLDIIKEKSVAIRMEKA
ncbi:MAG: homoserine dehydrogenase [Candidatus Omnitrophota bacterium]|nr:homoserine dehydrogenase [Candidatus Omnitrophota bacterium]MBU1929211.1 homoserine dehydrogenase [Candidatus Omnitrophota bacterium]MBU2034540.1 homoserine dehydrogenase [Candidatus Omnitrophota bacterium]MBU2221205.1 homoserine dehydrogenase [Candidatus Omnitrophota bacterium]